MGCMQMPARNNIIVNFAIAALLKCREVGPSSKRANNGGGCAFICARLRRRGDRIFSRADTPIHGGSKDATRLRK